MRSSSSGSISEDSGQDLGATGSPSRVSVDESSTNSSSASQDEDGEGDVAISDDNESDDEEPGEPNAAANNIDITGRQREVKKNRAQYMATLPRPTMTVQEGPVTAAELAYTFIEADNTKTKTYEQREMERIRRERAKRRKKRFPSRVLS